MSKIQENIANKKAILLEALKKTMNNISSACKKTGIGRTAVYQWIEKDPAFAAEVKALNDFVLDFIESKAHELINGVVTMDGEGRVYTTKPDSQMIRFYLETKGKGRGFVKRSELAGVDGMPLVTGVKIEISGSKSKLDVKVDQEKPS